MSIVVSSLVALSALGCGGESPAPAPPPLSAGRGSPPADDADSDEAQTAEEEQQLDGIVILPEEEASSTFTGALATTATVPFGGNGFCTYDITLRDVAIEVDVTPAGEIARATVRDLAVEKALDGCPYAPMEPSIQDFTLKSAAVTTTGTRLELAGAKANRPATSLVIDLVQSGSGYGATATWKRTDQTGPLAWSVTAKVKLAPKAAPM